MYTINFATYFQLLFSLFKLLFSLFKKKTIFLSIISHLLLYLTSPTFLLPLYLIIFLLLFTLPLNFLHPFFFLIYWLFFSLSYLYKVDIISSIQFIFFPYKNCEYSLSLSLSQWIFVLSYNSNLGWWFFYLILICVLMLCFINFSSQIPLITLVGFRFGLIIGFF